MAMSTRKKLEIPDKAWLDTLKFLMRSQWRKMSFVSHQIAKVVRGNISEMPRIIIDNVSFWKDCHLKYFLDKNTPICNHYYSNFIHSGKHLKPIKMVAYGIVIPPNEKKEWFMKRGINLDAPAELQHQGAIVGTDAMYGDQNKPSIFYYADGNEPAGASKITWSKQEMTKRQEYQGIRKLENSIFSAAFNPVLNEYSWASMEYFLNLLYNPLTYIKPTSRPEPAKGRPARAGPCPCREIGPWTAPYRTPHVFVSGSELCKSLSWIQRNVRAELIYLPGQFIDVNNSFKETSKCLLDMPWMCAKQTRNVKVKFEYVHYWKSFIKILIKKFCLLDTIEHATPSIEFRCKNLDGNPDLTFLVWDPEVVKLKPEDSQGAEAVYMISNGRNRMEIALFKRHDLESDRAVKMPRILRYSNIKKSEAIYDVSIKTYTIESATPSQEKVRFLNDTWLEALKFLSFPTWSKALFVSRQLAGVVQCNISRLPCIIVDSATIPETRSVCSDVVVFDETIPANEQNHFFTELGISLNAPDDVHYEKVFIGFSSKRLAGENRASKCNSIAIILSGAPQVQTIFSGVLNKEQEHLWAALKYFLEFLYYPAVYTKEVEMFALKQKLIDDCFGGAERFIRCGLFTWKGEKEAMTSDDFDESLSWLEKNIRAETIVFPMYIDTMAEDYFYDRISIFLLDSSWNCARNEVKFEWIYNLNRFLEALAKKFRSVSFVRNDIPTFTATAYGDDETMSLLLLDPDVKKLKSEDSETVDMYLISNGDNRMQIEIVKRRKYDPNEDYDHNYEYDYEYFGDSDDDYGYDYHGEEDVEHDDDFRKEEKECIINVKVYRV